MQKNSPASLEATGIYSLIDCNLRGDLRPKTGIFDRRDLLLGIPVHVHVQHEATERGPQVVGQILIRHTAKDQIHVQLPRDLIDGQVLTVQTHPGKKVELAPVKKLRG